MGETEIYHQNEEWEGRGRDWKLGFGTLGSKLKQTEKPLTLGTIRYISPNRGQPIGWSGSSRGWLVRARPTKISDVRHGYDPIKALATANGCSWPGSHQDSIKSLVDGNQVKNNRSTLGTFLMPPGIWTGHSFVHGEGLELDRHR